MRTNTVGSALPLVLGSAAPPPDVRPAPTWVLAWRGGLALAACAFGLRAAVIVGAMLVHHHSLEDIYFFRDGRSYIAVARVLAGEPFPLTAYDLRVFPGFPALLAVLHGVTRLPFGLLGLLVNWICAALVSVQAALVFRDKRVGWAMACLTPSYLMYSSLVLTESLFLSLALAGVWLATRTAKSALAGLVFGLAAAVRPVALFPTAAAALVLCLQKRWRSVLVIGATSAFVVGAVLLFNKQWQGDALANFNRYQSVGGFHGSLFVAPFYGLFTSLFSARLTLWKSVYLLLHVLFALATCVLAVREVRATRTASPTDSAADRLAVLACTWLIGNTAFAVCIGSDAGVTEFHRYIVPALPAAFYFLRKYLPVKALPWSIIALGSFVLAVAGARQ